MGVICMNPFRLMRRIHADYSHAVMQSCHAHYQHPCAAGQTEVAKLLIDSNASVNPTILIDPLNSPLHEAVMKG